MDDDKVWSGFSMTSRRNVARAIATVLGALVMLAAALQGTALAAGPELTIAQPESPSANQTPIFSGTTTDTSDPITFDFDPVTLDIYAGAVPGGTPVQSWTAFAPSSEGTFGDGWEITPEALEQGEYTAVASQTNSELETGTSPPVSFTIDTTAPAVSINEVHTPTNNPRPLLSGGAGVAAGDEPAVTVTVYYGDAVGGTVAASETVSRSGSSWFYTPTTLADGTYTAQATQEDRAHNVGESESVTFTVDTTAPTVSIGAVTSPTNNAMPPLNGGAGVTAGDKAAVAVAIYEGGSVSGHRVDFASVPRSGSSWSYTPPSKLPEGTYTAQAYQEDEAGNVGESAAVTFTVLLKGPQVSINAVHSPTNKPEPGLSGSAATSPFDEPTVIVTVYKGGAVGGAVAASGSASLSGATWSYTPSTLSDGTYTAQATQEDKAHNVGASAGVTFTVDTTAPTVTINPMESPTKNAEPTLSGGAGVALGDETSVAVAIYEGGSVSGQRVDLGVVSRSGSSWSYTPSSPLPEGTYTAQAHQEDEADNVGASATTTFMVVTKAPEVSINSIGPTTTNSTPTLTGSAATAALDEPTVTVMIYEGSSPTGRAKASPPVSLSGSDWSYTTPALKDGTYTAEAVQEDQAHNVGTSPPTTFTIDTPTPKVTVIAPANKATVHLTQPTISGSASDDTSVNVKIYEGSSVSGPLTETIPAAVEGEHWTITAADEAKELANGPYTAQAEQSDAAGNIGKSNPVSFTVSSVLTVETAGFERGGRSGLVAGPTPRFQGSAQETSSIVEVRIYRGDTASGTPEREVEGKRTGARWGTEPLQALPSGVYTVEVEQGTTNLEFPITVDATPPQVSLSSPANASSTFGTSQAVSGAAGVEEGDLNSVAIHLYGGAGVSGPLLQTLSTEASNGSWAAAFGGLSPGTYTAEAEQSDDVGNIGHSEAVTFTVVALPAQAAATPSAPVASFKWIPADPQAGEPVTLASNSTAGSSPIVSYAWSLSGNGVFTHGESTLTTVFATPGSYTVQLRVTDANGLSSTVAEKVAVATAAIPLMQPFPVVRMAGSFGRSGARISLLTALAPVGANVTITCHGKGCPTKSQGFVAAAGAKSKSGTVQITFKRFERFLRSGVVVEIWISKHGQIGKFTRFVIHAGKSPTRVDQCLNPAGTTPIVCPS
jgi:large repetitive protein